MGKNEILSMNWDINDSRKGVAAFSNFMAECVMPWDIESWIKALSENYTDYPGWETNPSVVKEFISDMLF